MKELQFTEQELQTLSWALQNEYCKYYRTTIEQGGKINESETLKKLLNLSKKVYGALIEEFKNGTV